jgi:hypothetical protein
LHRSNATRSFVQALGIDVSGGASEDASSALAVGQRLLEQVMPPVLRTLAYESGVVCLSCMAFLNSYLARVKNIAKRHNGLETSAQMQLLLIMRVRGCWGPCAAPMHTARRGSRWLSCVVAQSQLPPPWTQHYA